MKLVMFKNGELWNEPTFPVKGWVYLQGASLKGQAPQEYPTLEDLVQQARRLAKASRRRKGNVYFNVAEQGNAVIDL